MAGLVELKKDDFEDATEIGFMIHFDYWGKGISKEAGRAVLRFAFNTFGLTRIVAKCVPENRRSLRLLDSMNMIRVADLPEWEGDHWQAYARFHLTGGFYEPPD